MTGLKHIYSNVFHIIKNKGLNVDLVSWADRATEAWAFGKDLILDSTGRPVKQTKSTAVSAGLC